MPFRYNERLVEGAGTAVRANVALLPSTIPVGRSPSTNVGAPPPQGPEEPSTCMQSVATPVADSTRPEPSTTAVRPAAKAGPLMGRAARSLISDVTCDSGTGPVRVPVPVPLLPPVPLPPPVAEPVEGTRTSRTR